jgi:hypothetical protein
MAGEIPPQANQGLRLVEPFTTSDDVDASERYQLRRRVAAALWHVREVERELNGLFLDLPDEELETNPAEPWRCESSWERGTGSRPAG